MTPSKQELAFRAVEADDISLAVLEMIKTVNAVRTISTPNIGEIATITGAINDLIAQLKRVSDSMKAMMEDSGRASMEETLTRGLSKKANNAPLVAGKQLPTPDSKPKTKEAVAAKTPIYKDYVVVAVIMGISALAGALIRGLF